MSWMTKQVSGFPVLAGNAHAPAGDDVAAAAGELDRMLVEKFPVGVQRLAVVGGDGGGRFLRKHRLRRPAYHLLARDAEVPFAFAIDQDIAEITGILHQDDRRHVFDHAVKEVARFLKLALRLPTLGDVLVGHHPAAVRHRQIGHVDHAAVGELMHRLGRLAVDDRGHQRVGVVRGIGLEEGAGGKPQIDQLAHCHARLHGRTREPVHLEVALVGQHQAAGGVQHVEALRHVAERGVEQDVLLAQFFARAADAKVGDQIEGQHRRRQGERKGQKQGAVHRLGPLGDGR
jgi:hypothetical protein